MRSATGEYFPDLPIEAAALLDGFLRGHSPWCTTPMVRTPDSHMASNKKFRMGHLVDVSPQSCGKVIDRPPRSVASPPPAASGYAAEAHGSGVSRPSTGSY